MLRPMKKHPKCFDQGDEAISLRGCPDCHGRGWFLIQPFKTSGGDGSGGMRNKTQCPTCKSAADHYSMHGSLPVDIALAMSKQKDRLAAR